MSDRLELIKAILAEDCPDDAVARRVLAAALEHEIDPLDYCAMVLGVGEAQTLERAARWAGLAFFDVVPRGLDGIAEPVRLEALAEVRAFRLRLFDRDVLFCAPRFFALLRLKAQLRADPALLRRLCLVPPGALRAYLVRASAPALLDHARQNLTRHWPFAAAQLELTGTARRVFVLALLLLVVLVLHAPFSSGQHGLLALALCVLAVPTGLRIAAIGHALTAGPPAVPPRLGDIELPVYSVLIPLCNEAHMVPQLCAAMRALDYPPEKLDIKFVVEASSIATLAALRPQLDDSRFSLVPVPEALPLTKPKALDFALPLCRGEHVVVFDAEDTPDPGQLRLAASRFRHEPDLQCLQAELWVDNAGEGLLTDLFAAEYAGLFGVMLPALAAWHMPLPLGGTSNHFRTATLRALGGWDAFNVTEDADLGMRLARMGHRTAMLASRTLEEAPTRLSIWMRQRTRWMKGWMQTFIVHNRRPWRLLAQMGLPAMLVFEFHVLGMIVAPLLHTAFLLLVLVRLALGLPAASGDPVLAVYLGIFAIGYAAALAVTLIGLYHQRRGELFIQQLLLPLYWLLMAAATLLALRQLLERPFHWAKTEHRAVRASRTRALNAARVSRRA